MTQDVKHSPLPWVVRFNDFDGCWNVYPTDEGMGEECGFGEWTEVAQCRLNENDNSDDDGKLDAQFIVTACNSHYELVEALERLCMVQEGVPMTGIQATQYLKDARNALAKVKP